MKDIEIRLAQVEDEIFYLQMKDHWTNADWEHYYKLRAEEDALHAMREEA